VTALQKDVEISVLKSNTVKKSFAKQKAINKPLREVLDTNEHFKTFYIKKNGLMFEADPTIEQLKPVETPFDQYTFF
jgi:hypothetical protein